MQLWIPVQFLIGVGFIFDSLLRFGLVCLGMNLVMDYPMFAYGPMKMTPGQYYSEIGVAYLIYPIFGWWASRMGK